MSQEKAAQQFAHHMSKCIAAWRKGSQKSAYRHMHRAGCEMFALNDSGPGRARAETLYNAFAKAVHS